MAASVLLKRDSTDCACAKEGTQQVNASRQALVPNSASAVFSSSVRLNCTTLSKPPPKSVGGNESVFAVHSSWPAEKQSAEEFCPHPEISSRASAPDEDAYFYPSWP